MLSSSLLVKNLAIMASKQHGCLAAESISRASALRSSRLVVLRSFSTPPQPSSPEETEFRSEKARDLFLRITSTCSKEDVERLSDGINQQLGRVFRKNEFYYRGFGGAGGGRGVAQAAEAAAAVEIKLTVDIKLVGFDAKAKIKVIKEVRSIVGLGLKESKELVEGAPVIIQKDLKPEKAEEIKAQLEELGAIIELV
jgi:large subunit ribosomal protein L7/L12